MPDVARRPSPKRENSCFQGLNQRTEPNEKWTLVEGDPTRDATILADYENRIDLIMKDGGIHKNTQDGAGR